jgi:hypothetical protein
MSAASAVDDAMAVYKIVSRTHVNQWSNELQQAVPGWDIRAYWVKTGTTLPVFVPDAQYTADNVDAIIRHYGALDEKIHSLGA